MKKTFKEVRDIDVAVGSLYRADSKLRESDFGINYTKFYEESYVPIISEYQKELTKLRIDYALCDKNTGAVLLSRTNPRGYEYDKNGLKSVIDAEEKFVKQWDNKEVDITPCVFSGKKLPDMSEDIKAILKGVII